MPVSSSGGPLVLRGGIGDDYLKGGAADDFLSGAHGDDSFFVDDALDSVVEDPGEGFDTVTVSIGDYSVPANVEKAVLRGTADLRMWGNGGNNSLFGNIGHNHLLGLGGSDKIHGGGGDDRLEGGDGDDHLAGDEGNDRLDGGTGADTMAGGPGNDGFYVDSHFDSVVEHAGEGFDTVWVSVGGYYLPQNVERGILTGTADLQMFGSDANDILIGNSGDNRLGGLRGDDDLHGQAGNDELFGFYGNDRLYGGDGDDWLLGYRGTDLLTGGSDVRRSLFAGGRDPLEHSAAPHQRRNIPIGWTDGRS
jgi:Ca2+-binding RTX toxin-like protein